MKIHIEDDDKIRLHIPMSIKISGNRSLVIFPPEVRQQLPAPAPKTDDALVKAVCRAFRWKRMMEKENLASMAEIARKEKVTDSYVTRILRLTLLAPDIVEAIYYGRQPKGLMLADMLKPFPLIWEEQRQKFGFYG